MSRIQMSVCEWKWCKTIAAKTHWTAHLTLNQTQPYTMKLFLLPDTQWVQHTDRSTSMACQKRVSVLLCTSNVFQRQWDDSFVKTFSKAFNWFTSKQHQHTISILFLLPLFLPSSDWAILALISGSGSLRAYFETILDGTPNMWSVDQCAPTTFMPKPLYSCSQRVNSTFIQDSEHRFGVKYESYWLVSSPRSQCQISTWTWLNRNKSWAHKKWSDRIQWG